MPSVEQVAAEIWMGRARQEGAAAHAFAKVANSLRADAAPQVLVEAAHDSGYEEVRHAALCADLVAQLGLRCDTDAQRKHAAATSCAPSQPAILAHEVVALCCITETLSAVLLTAMLERCEHQGVRYVLHEVLRDEITHSRIGWGYLAARGDALRNAGALEAIPSALVGMLATTVPPTVFSPEPQPVLARELEAFGCLSRATICELFAQTVTEVILPGLEEAAIDTRAARRWLDARVRESAHAR
jgi:hypothetical protein